MRMFLPKLLLTQTPHIFPGMIASDSRPRNVGMEFPSRSRILVIDFSFPSHFRILGMGFFPIPSRSPTFGMELSIPVPVTNTQKWFPLTPDKLFLWSSYPPHSFSIWTTKEAIKQNTGMAHLGNKLFLLLLHLLALPPPEKSASHRDLLQTTRAVIVRTPHVILGSQIFMKTASNQAL